MRRKGKKKRKKKKGRAERKRGGDLESGWAYSDEGCRDVPGVKVSERYFKVEGVCSSLRTKRFRSKGITQDWSICTLGSPLLSRFISFSVTPCLISDIWMFVLTIWCIKLAPHFLYGLVSVFPCLSCMLAMIFVRMLRPFKYSHQFS